MSNVTNENCHRMHFLSASDLVVAFPGMITSQKFNSLHRTEALHLSCKYIMTTHAVRALSNKANKTQLGSGRKRFVCGG